MDQHVTVGNADLPVQVVGVAEKNQTIERVSSRESVSGGIDRTDALVDHSWVASGSRGLFGCALAIIVFNALWQQGLHRAITSTAWTTPGTTLQFRRGSQRVRR